jgi:flagellar assembly factor FliW
MPQVATKHFATLEYDAAAILTFPAGLPAFDGLTRFLLIEHPSVAPLIFLQSLEEKNVCFPVLPVVDIDADYELALTGDDLEVLGFSGPGQLPAGNELACFAVISVASNGTASANLAAPVVVRLSARVGVQAVRTDARYSHQQLLAEAKEGVCS